MAVKRQSQSMTRVGIVAKAQLRAATTHLQEIADWLETRGIQPVFETETAALLPSGKLRAVASKGCSAIQCSRQCLDDH